MTITIGNRKFIVDLENGILITPDGTFDGDISFGVIENGKGKITSQEPQKGLYVFVKKDGQATYVSDQAITMT